MRSIRNLTKVLSVVTLSLLVACGKPASNTNGYATVAHAAMASMINPLSSAHGIVGSKSGRGFDFTPFGSSTSSSPFVGGSNVTYQSVGQELYTCMSYFTQIPHVQDQAVLRAVLASVDQCARKVVYRNNAFYLYLARNMQTQDLGGSLPYSLAWNSPMPYYSYTSIFGSAGGQNPLFPFVNGNFGQVAVPGF